MRILKVVSCFVILCIIFTSCAVKDISEKEIIEISAVHPAYTLETMTEAAETIVHGTVIEKGESFIHTSETNTGRIIESVFTPITISVTDCLKGDATETVVYNQRGGEIENKIYEFNDGGEVEVGEEVILFLNEVNVTWGGQGVYKIEDGNTTVENRMLPITLYSADSESAYSEISPADLKSLVLAYIDQ